MRGKSMNWELIADNLIDARHQLDSILSNIGHPEMTVGRFKALIEHALHHTIVAWNVRHMPSYRYAAMEDDTWNRLCKLPDGLVPMELNPPPEPAPAKGKFPRGNGKRFLARHYTRSEHEFDWRLKRKRVAEE